MAWKQDQKNLLLLQIVLVLAIVGTLTYALLHKSSGNEADSEATGTALAKDANGNGASSDGKTADGSAQRSADGYDAAAANGDMTAANGSSSPANLSFDPNTADSATLVAVGFSSFQARNILRYRAKGGRYHSKEEVKKVYALTVNQWRHIEPLIHIGKGEQYIADTDEAYVAPQRHYNNRQASYGSNQTSYGSSQASNGNEQASNGNRPDNTETGSGSSPNTSSGTAANEQTRALKPVAGDTRTSYPTKLRQGETIDLAQADTNMLKRVPGIGSYYARRIAEHGARLGGYVSVDQLNDAELDCLPEGIERWMTLSKAAPRQLHINRCTTRQLNNHPYISYPQAKQLSSHIRLYGAIKSWNELLQLSEFSEADKARLLPYIAFD